MKNPDPNTVKVDWDLIATVEEINSAMNDMPKEKLEEIKANLEKFRIERILDGVVTTVPPLCGNSGKNEFTIDATTRRLYEKPLYDPPFIIDSV